jgi:hypothetical protein
MDVAGTDDTADDTAEGRAGTMTRWYGPIRGVRNGDGRADGAGGRTLPFGGLPDIHPDH